jgi:hypothetical protein
MCKDTNSLFSIFTVVTKTENSGLFSLVGMLQFQEPYKLVVVLMKAKLNNSKWIDIFVADVKIHYL